MTGIVWPEYVKEVLNLDNQEIRPLSQPNFSRDDRRNGKFC